MPELESGKIRFDDKVHRAACNDLDANENTTEEVRAKVIRDRAVAGTRSVENVVSEWRAHEDGGVPADGLSVQNVGVNTRATDTHFVDKAAVKLTNSALPAGIFSEGFSQRSLGTALVTGAGRRLGRAIALRLAEKGFDIAIHYNGSSEDAESCAREVTARNRKCGLFRANLLDAAELQSLVEDVSNRMACLSLLVNNASIWKPASFIESSARDLYENVGIHLVAPYLLTRDFARLAQQGQVINILDTEISKNYSSFFPYLLTKKALHELTMMCALELAPRFRVNALAPGIVLPVPAEDSAESYKKLLDDNPLCHGGGPADVLAGLEYLLSSPHVTGQCLFISGGDQLL